jgi:hypothetical protein
MRQESATAISLFQNEIENAGLNPAGTAFSHFSNGKVSVDCEKKTHLAEPILEASETVFHFMGDKNANGNSENGNENVRYEYVGKGGIDRCHNPQTSYTLYRDTGGGLQEVATGIAKFQLDYFDGDGTRLPAGFLTHAERMRIRSVAVTLQPVTKDTPKEKKRPWRSEIFLKNIG